MRVKNRVIVPKCKAVPTLDDRFAIPPASHLLGHLPLHKGGFDTQKTERHPLKDLPNQMQAVVWMTFHVKH